MYPSYIEFSETETVNTIYSPKPEAWQFIPIKNRLFLKPIEEGADTTLTVMTNQRVYFFELHAQYAAGPFDPNLVFFIKFRYPSEIREQGQGIGNENSIIQYVMTDIPDLSKPDKYNFNYTVSGDYNITPIKIFDDGTFTYMEFREKSGILPAIFKVDSTGYEAMINFRMIGPYIAVEGIFPVLSLRYGPETVCVFNETMQISLKSNQSKNR